MKSFFRVLGALALGVASASAQVNTVPQVGQVSAYLQKQSYSAAFFGLVPPASATDTICIAGSATKTIRVRQIVVSGTAGTLVTVPLTLVRRASVATGGTAASTTANPANTISKRDTANATATAVPISYTAVPTITDSSPTYLASAALTLPVTSAGVVSVPLVFDFMNDPVGLVQPPTLRGAAQQLCVNFSTVSISSGLINGSITWTEE